MYSLIFFNLLPWGQTPPVLPQEEHDAAPKIILKASDEKFSLKHGILPTDYLPKGQTINNEYYSSLLVQVKDILKAKLCGKVTKGVLFLHDNAPGSPGTCNPEETGLPGLPVSWSPTLFSRSGTVGLPPVPWTEKTIERSPFFVQCRGHCCRRDLVGRTTFWIFFWVACKVRAMG